MTTLLIIILASPLLFTAWCSLAALIGRWLARREVVVITEWEIEQASRPLCAPIEVTPLRTSPNGHVEYKNNDTA